MMACHHSHARTTTGEDKAQKPAPDLAEDRILGLKHYLKNLIAKQCRQKCRTDGGTYGCKTDEDYDRCSKDCNNIYLKEGDRFKCVKKGKKYLKLQNFYSSGRILIN